MDTFTKAFFEALLWSSCGDDGEPLDATYGVDHIDPNSRKALEIECQQFQKEYADSMTMANLTDEQCGHDFALTRNHHGAGFWDRGLGPIGSFLTTAAQKFNQVDLYVGDDGTLYY